jgi:hypothetical protein
VPKESGTATDVLVAYGLAAVCHELLWKIKSPGGGYSVVIRDDGAHYVLELSERIRPEWPEVVDYFTVVKGVRTPKAGTGDMPLVDVEDLDTAWQEIRQYLAARAASREASSGGTSEIEAEEAEMREVDPKHWITVYLGTRQMQALKTYNRLALQWFETRDHFATNLKALLAMHACPGMDRSAVAAAWRNAVGSGPVLEVTASQLLNPHQGKGQNRPKANALAMENVKSFWLTEYLKAAGLWRCAVPRVVRGGDDRKTYVLAPTRISLAAHAEVFDRFSARLWSQTAAKMDCLALLLYADCLLEHSLANRFDELDFDGRSLDRVVSGFHVAHYKLLSRNAYTMMSLGFLGMPAWVGRIEDRRQVRLIREVIAENLDVVEFIDEARSDGYQLLVEYRDFLSAGRWESFFAFAGGFAAYLMSELDRVRRGKARVRVRRFSVNNLEVMLMQGNPSLLPIVQNPGFRHIARAIRQSTVNLQYLAGRDKGATLPYEIRYGLAQDLLRKSNRDEEFVAAVSDFVWKYNAENARAAEKQQDTWRREAVTERDLDELIRLVDQYHASVVAPLLVAYGYARETRQEESGAAQE